MSETKVREGIMTKVGFMSYEDAQEIDDLISEFDGRFASGNAVPVDQSRITAKEWQGLRKFIMRGFSTPEWAK